MAEISSSIHKMIINYVAALRISTEYRGPKLKVDHLVSKVSSAYEKLRNAVEYQEEHLIRRSAIERGLKRRWHPKKDARNMAKSLVLDLIRGRYLPDDKLPESSLDDVEDIVSKYIHLANISKGYIEEKREKDKVVFWLISLCACEIEEYFSPPLKEQTLIVGMFEVFHEYIKLAQQKMTKEEKDIQVYVAIMRGLTKYDNTLIAWNLFRQHCPEWTNADMDSMSDMAKKLLDVRARINQELKHRLGEKIMRFIQRHAIIFWIMQDIIEKNKGNSLSIFSNPDELEKEIIEACNSRYKKTRVKRRRATLRSFIYIFLTKMMMALALEVPYDFYILEHANYVPIGINVFFHPFLLFFVASTIRMPRSNNTKKIVQSIRAIAFKSKSTPLYQIKIFKPTRKYLEATFYLLYLILFIISFGIIIYVLGKLDFNIVSGILFLFFITVISFFGLKMRQMVRELILIKRKEGFIARLINFLSLPVLRAGRWISGNITSINVLIFVLDYIIERPFKKTMEISEEFVEYVKEKEEEIY